MSKIDLFKPQWLDVVFAGRNKEYGAYDLRMGNSRTTNRAVVVGVILFVIAIITPLIVRYIAGIMPEQEAVKVTEVVLAPPPAIDKKEVPPPPPEPPKPKMDQVKFPPPVVVPADQVRDEEPPTVEQLKVADPGQKTIEGDPNAEIKIDEPIGEAPKQAEVTEDVNTIFTSVEVSPDPPGGMKKFYEFVGKNYRYPAMAREQGVSGKVIMQFVVERDGSLTDIKVLRDLGLGTGEEAVRLLKSVPKWKPGIQNGRAVRVAYTLPLSLNLAGQ